jgi:hypothetical protein
MFINKIDDLFDGYLNKLYEYLIQKKTFDKLNKDTNFVIYQNDILGILKEFISKNVSKKEILDIIKNESYYEYILGTVKRYCAFYIYLGIAYYYSGGRDLFITNIIESSKNQKDLTFSIPNFYNSENNSKMINFFNDIKNIQTLIQIGKTIDKIKIVIANNPLKFDSTLKLFNDLGEDYIIENFLQKDNFHNILKTLIFRQIYLKEEKNEIVNFLNQEEQVEGEYIYIEIIQSNEKKLIDFTLIQKFLTLQQLRSGLADEIYDYLLEMRESRDFIIRENKDFINFLFSKGILVPINEDFLRFHDNNEKYDTESIVSESLKERDATKIKYVMNKIQNVRNYYSPMMDKNPKLKLDTEKLFHLSYEPRKAVLYNDNEEIKIVQKLKMSENAGDADLLIDLENMRKYPFNNFKHFSKDGFKLRTGKTIESIRSTSLKKKKDEFLDLRVGHDNLDLAVIGIAWNPSQIPLNCFKVEDMVNIDNLGKDKNKFNIFLKTISKTFDHSKNRKLYYWMFDTKKDFPKAGKYEDINVDDSIKNIKIMISQIYDTYIDLVKHKYESYIKNLDEISNWNLDNILSGYASRYFDFNLNPNVKNYLIEKTLKTRLKELEITVDDVDEMIPGKRDVIIELPKLKIEKEKKNIIKLNFEEEEEIELEKIKNEPLCYHYLQWRNINRLSKLKSEDFSQAVVDFAKQYIKISKTGDYLCKSCNEELSIRKFIYEGTYVEELDTFMTTNIAVNQKLEEISKYSKYLRTIRNLEKNIEKIAYSTDLISYIGSSPTIRLKRKLLIKDVIDLILLHTEYLRKQPKNRIEEYSKKYNINKDFTNLFFFELKDDIFLTSSTDTDYYKLIKYNNVISYLLFFIILEINPGQILNLKDDKNCNYFFFDKVGKTLFSNIFLRLNQKEKIPIEKIPLLCYTIYYLSCVFTNNRIWLWNENLEGKNKEEIMKAKQSSRINVQKTIINTLIDLMNSITEANYEVPEEDNKIGKAKEKNYLYEFIINKLSQKIKIVFSDVSLLKRIEEKSQKKVTFDEKTKKISFIAKKSLSVEIFNNITTTDLIQTNNERCDTVVSEMEYIDKKQIKTNLDLLTNCSDGKFHKWKFDKNDLVCSLCNQSYNELLKLYHRTTSSEDENKNYLHKLKIFNLNKLAKKYCLTGELHEIGNDGNCRKCKKNPETVKFNDRELEKMEKNIEEMTYEDNLEAIKEMKKHLEKKEEEENNIKNIIDKFNKRYETETNNKIYSYISDFVDRLSKILGNKIKIQDEIIYLKDTIYTLDHDYFGNIRKEPVYILSSDNKIETYKNHPNYNKDVLYYKDKANNVFVYYDMITFQYLGYSENNKEFKKTKSNATLKVNLSIRDSLLLLGIENKYVNIYHLNSSLQNLSMKEILEKSNILVNNYLRTRIGNLKQIISRVISIINNINNNGKFNSLYGAEEKSVIDEFTKKIKNFNLNNKKEDSNNQKDSNNKKEDSIFKDWKYINNNLGFNEIPENIKINISQNYFDTSVIDYLNNSDCKLIFFLIQGLNKLLDYNSQISIQSELSHLIIKLIKFSLNQYYRPYSNSQVRKFDFVLINETPYIDDNLKVIGFYQELLNNKEIEDKKEKEKDDNYDAQQAFESMDIDDFEINDDIDESMEAYDASGPIE